MTPGVIQLQEVTSGRTVAKLEDPHGDLSTWMGFTPDGAQLIVVARYAGAIHRWDLRAIRARLKTMNLDWDWPGAEREFTRAIELNPSYSEAHHGTRSNNLRGTRRKGASFRGVGIGL